MKGLSGGCFGVFLWSGKPGRDENTGANTFLRFHLPPTVLTLEKGGDRIDRDCGACGDDPIRQV